MKNVFKQLKPQDFNKAVDPALFAAWKKSVEAHQQASSINLVLYAIGFIALVFLHKSDPITALVLFFTLSIAGIAIVLPKNSKRKDYQRKLGFSNNDVKEAIDKCRNRGDSYSETDEEIYINNNLPENKIQHEIQQEESPLSEPHRYNGFQWFCKALSHYADFSGRARRKEYWYFTLFNIIFLFAWAFLIGILSASTNSSEENVTVAVYGYYVITGLPGLAVSVRRLHDLGKSGWMILIALIPIVGSIWLLVLMCNEGQHGKNEYGHDPKTTKTPFDEPARLKSAGVALIVASAIVLLASNFNYLTTLINYGGSFHYMRILNFIIPILTLIAGAFLLNEKTIYGMREKGKYAFILILTSVSISFLFSVSNLLRFGFLNTSIVLVIFCTLSIALFTTSVLFLQQNKSLIRTAAVTVIIFSGLTLFSDVYRVLEMSFGDMLFYITFIFNILLPVAYIVLAGTFLSAKAQAKIIYASVPVTAQENARVTVPHYGGYEKKAYFTLEHKVASRYRNAGEHQILSADRVEIGRDPACEVRFDENFETVSRRHAAIVRDGNNWKLVPLSQTNPSFINGKTVQGEWYLQNGDEIQCAVNGPKLVFRTNLPN